MAPVRTEKRTQSSQPIAGPSHRKNKRHPPNDDSSVLPGVQKIKAAIRQAKRLLAKDKLAADVRVTTERKLNSLQADLAKAELKRKEQLLSTRYHKVKFFERQKVVRKINQTKRKLSEAESSNRPSLEAQLYEHRVELNYINHYPKTKKYISLFPPDIQHNTEIELPSVKTDQEREEVKKWIREQMASQVLPTEPENVERSQSDTSQAHWVKKVKKNDGKRVEEEDEEHDDFFE
ncbi:hypothetical protein EV360DRAFT_52510 [Lentinula raphanica]|nr:hypothetical protein EV360DRAFT_52510 [Lentinula raphanica]